MGANFGSAATGTAALRTAVLTLMMLTATLTGALQCFACDHSFRAVARAAGVALRWPPLTVLTVHSTLTRTRLTVVVNGAGGDGGSAWRGS